MHDNDLGRGAIIAIEDDDHDIPHIKLFLANLFHLLSISNITAG